MFSFPWKCMPMVMKVLLWVKCSAIYLADIALTKKVLQKNLNQLLQRWQNGLSIRYIQKKHLGLMFLIFMIQVITAGLFHCPCRNLNFRLPQPPDNPQGHMFLEVKDFCFCFSVSPVVITLCNGVEDYNQQDVVS